MQSSRLNVRFFAHLTLTYFNITSVYLAYQPMNNWKYATKNVHASSKLEKLLYVLTSCYMSFHLIIFRGSMHSMQFSWFFHFSYCFLFALHFFFFFFRLNLFQLPNMYFKRNFSLISLCIFLVYQMKKTFVFSSPFLSLCLKMFEKKRNNLFLLLLFAFVDREKKNGVLHLCVFANSNYTITLRRLRKEKKML